MKSKKICPLATRIKKMMQTDDDVGKISQATPILIGRAMELFLEKLCKQAIGVAQSRQAKTLTPSHLKAAVTADTTLDFLAELVAPAPDLPPADPDGGDGAPKAVKRRRTNDAGDGPASPQGRGRSKQQAADHGDGETPAPKPARSRAPKPPVPPASAGGSGPPSRSGSGNLAEQAQPANGGAATSGRRGAGRPRKDAKGAAAAATAAAGSGGEPAGMQSDVPVVVSPPAALGGSISSLPHSAAVTSPMELGTIAAASSAARHTASAGSTGATAVAVKPDLPGGAAGSTPAGNGGGGGGGGAGGSVIASLRAQQPFFGLGRRGKNLGTKGGNAAGMTPAAPSPAGFSAAQQQATQQLLEAGAGALGLSSAAPGPGTQPAFALKLEPLDLSWPARPFMGLPPLPTEVAAHRGGDAPMDDVGGNGADAGAAAAKAEGGDSDGALTSSVSPFEMRQHHASFSAGPGVTRGGLGAGLGGIETEPVQPQADSAAVVSALPGSLDQPQQQPGVASSAQLLPLAVAAGGVSNSGMNGSLLPQLGASLALFQSQGDMDDDYDDC